MSDAYELTLWIGIVRHLEALDIPYMLVGSMGTNLYGEPRSTNGVDIVIDPTESQLDVFCESVEEHVHIDPDVAHDALRRRSIFYALDMATSEKVDLIVLRDSPYDRCEFGRRIKKRILGVEATAITPEDLVLSKLNWAKQGESERQIRDVVGVLVNQWDNLDWDYVHHWASELNVTEVLDRAMVEARKNIGNE